MGPFDERLYALKLQEATKQLHGEGEKCWQRARAEVKRTGNQVGFFPALIAGEIELLRKYLEAVDRVCRDVCLLDGNSITPQFIRNNLRPRIFTVIAAQKGSIKGKLELYGGRTGESTTQGQHILIRATNRLETEMARRYEIEAIELGKPGSQVRATKVAVNLEHNLRSWLVEHGIAPTPEVLASFAQEGGQRTHGAESNSASRVIGNAREAQERANSWRSFHNRFMELAREEQGRADIVTKESALQAMRVLRIHGDYHMVLAVEGEIVQVALAPEGKSQ